jgi:hypothetical protein
LTLILDDITIQIEILNTEINSKLSYDCKNFTIY